MAHRVIRLVVCAGCLVLAVVPETRLAGAQGTPAIDRPMPYMQAMNRIFRLLQQQANDPSQNRSMLALAADLEWSTLSAKEAVPLRSTILPDVDRQAMLVAYRRLFLKLIRQELDLEEALLNDDQAAAARTLAAIEATEDEGHEKFR
jgi:hypothetical protein